MGIRSSTLVCCIPSEQPTTHCLRSWQRSLGFGSRGRCPCGITILFTLFHPCVLTGEQYSSVGIRSCFLQRRELNREQMEACLELQNYLSVENINTCNAVEIVQRCWLILQTCWRYMQLRYIMQVSSVSNSYSGCNLFLNLATSKRSQAQWNLVSP